MKPLVTANPWQGLRRFTSARIALGRTGDSLPTDAVLAFGLAHAQARDAVQLPLDTGVVEAQLDTIGVRHVKVHSEAADRATYLRRPDWGRCLDDGSRALLIAQQAAEPAAVDVVFVVGDGLSSRAVQAHAVAVLRAVLPRLDGWRIAPVIIAEQARVALGDEIGVLLRARQTVVLIGERPGLSSPDSLGLYLTFAPRVGRSDAERNCISNVRPEGLNPDQAAYKLAYLLHTASKLGRSGIALKDESGSFPPESQSLVNAC